jgi:hypothetical protein
MTLQELFSDESKWTKGASARDAYGNPCRWTSKQAVCFCLYGAIAKAYADDKEHNFKEITDKLRVYVFKQTGQPLSVFNDDFNTSFQDIRRVIEAVNV